MVDMEDLYEILGIEPGAVESVIEKSFKKLTRKCHPEVNPGDKEAETRYRTICRAYAILSDGGMRAEYDRLGRKEFFHLYPGGRRETGKKRRVISADIPREGFFGEILGLKKQEVSGRYPRCGEDIQNFITLDIFEVSRGTVKKIQISRKISCSACKGIGAASDEAREECPSCAGRGSLKVKRGPLSTREECRKCAGRGYLIKEACRVCQGSGLATTSGEIKVEVPRGVVAGSEIRLKGLGHAGEMGGPPGDLVVMTRIAGHPHFERKGDNLYSHATVMLWEAALGANILVPTVDGMVSLTILPGTQGGQKFELKGRGLPNLKTDKRGDHFVEIEVYIPPPSNEESKKAYRRLAELFPENPRVK